MNQSIENRIEFFRNGMALLPEPEDSNPGTVICIRGEKPGQDQIFCNCLVSDRKTCRHEKEFFIIYKRIKENYPSRHFDAVFQASGWNDFPGRMCEIYRETPKTIQMNLICDDSENRIKVVNSKNETIFLYYPRNHSDQNKWKDETLFMERCWDSLGQQGKARRIKIL